MFYYFVLRVFITATNNFVWDIEFGQIFYNFKGAILITFSPKWTISFPMRKRL